MSGNEPNTYFPQSANKAFSIIFTIAVFILNAAQLVVYVRRLKQTQIIKKPLHWMQMNLALTGLALCVSYVTEILLYFDRLPESSCALAFFLLKYSKDIYPFYFGCSLIVQGVYLVLKFNKKDWLSSQSSSWWLWTLLPVILTLLIIVPMTMTGTDCSLNVDWTRAKMKAVEVVYGVLPPAIAFILSLVIFSQRPDQSRDTRAEDYPLQMITSSVVPTAPHLLGGPEMPTVFQPPPRYAADPNPSLNLGEKGRPHFQQYQPPTAQQYPLQYHGQNHQPSHDRQVYPEQSYYGQSLQQNPAVTEQENGTPASRSGQMIPTVPITSDEVRRFFSIHFVVCLIFMLSVMPLSAYVLYVLDDNSFSSLKVLLTVGRSLYWTKHIYPVLIPLILICTGGSL